MLAPLALSDGGYTPLAIGAVFLAAGLIEVALNPVLGRYSDRVGRLLPIRFALAAAVAASRALALAESAALLALLVCTAAVAWGGFYTPGMALVSDRAEAAGLAQGLAFGVMNTAWALGNLTGPAAGGALAERFGDSCRTSPAAPSACLTLLAAQRVAASAIVEPRSSSRWRALTDSPSRERSATDDWNRRYSDTELLWTATPSRFLVAETAELPPGLALDLACGEGRNAVWLAEQGWDVVGVDFADVGLTTARRLAARRGVDVELVHADLLDYEPEPLRYDLVCVLYLHLPADERRPRARARRGRRRARAERSCSSATTSRTSSTATAGRANAVLLTPPTRSPASCPGSTREGRARAAPGRRRRPPCDRRARARAPRLRELSNGPSASRP